MEEQYMEIEFRFKNIYGEEHVTKRVVAEEFCGMTDLEILHDTYKNFLNNLTFPMDYNDEIVILRKNQHISTHISDCDCDCDCCKNEF